MTVKRDTFLRRAFNKDFQTACRSPVQVHEAYVVAERLVPTHCCVRDVQCSVSPKASDGHVIGVEWHDFPHNRAPLPMTDIPLAECIDAGEPGGQELLSRQGQEGREPRTHRRPARRRHKRPAPQASRTARGYTQEGSIGERH